MATNLVWFLNFLSIVVISVATVLHPLSDEFINLINTKQNSWRAGQNFPEDTPLEHLHRLASLHLREQTADVPVKEHDIEAISDLPESFDAREKWRNCPTIKEIRDQGFCGTCWAFACTEAMSDRICIFSNASLNVQLSAVDLASCCTECNEDINNICALGGNPETAWAYYDKVGIVTGGNYGSHEGCRPYTIDPSNQNPVAPTCEKKCEDIYKVPYGKDKHFGKNFYHVKQDEKQIMAELFKNGPVQVDFLVYEDFYSYQSGVYIHTGGDKEIGGHAVKVLGWGVEKDTKYWLVANSWNVTWGDNGYFKILRGENHCRFEEHVFAGEPLLQ